MALNLYIGPMFSGKTTAALKLIDTYIQNNESFLCITSKLDTRYSSAGKIVSHDMKSYDALSVSNLLPVLGFDEFLKADYIIIEESNFFPDLKTFVLYALESFGKHVTCIGLDGDYKREPFGQLLELVPYCSSIMKFKAICKMCHGFRRNAIFTHRITSESTQTLVGGKDTYESLCRIHYLARASL